MPSFVEMNVGFSNRARLKPTHGATTSAAVALSQAVTAGTPAGTVTITNQGSIAWPAGVPTIGAYTPLGSISAPTFTGTQFDNRSAFIRMIACKKD